MGLKMPVDIVIDYMHACLEGMGKQWLKLWFKSTNSRFAYYLGPRLCQMDSILNSTRYPSEFPRSQRSLAVYRLFKANEIRNLLFYCLIYVMKELLSKEYYENLLIYTLFLRILTNEKIESNDLEI